MAKGRKYSTDTELNPSEDSDIGQVSSTQKSPLHRAFSDQTGKFSEEELSLMGSRAVEGYVSDEDSRAAWLSRYKNWLRLCNVRPAQESKTYPWEGAANMVLPMITIACVQFQSRAEEALFSGGRDVVKGLPVGKEISDEERATRVSAYMNRQISIKMENFYEGFSSSLMQLPLGGTMVRKTYYDPRLQTTVTDYVKPENFVVNYFTRYLESCPRMTHVTYMTEADIKFRMETEIFRAIDLHRDEVVEEGVYTSETNQNTGISQSDSNDFGVRKVLEQHTYINLEGKHTPVILFVDYTSEKVLRIVTRLNPNKKSPKNTMHYFTKYGFIPNPDGGFYDIGFGALLEKTNEAVNGLTNLIFDSGHLANLQGGFIAKRSGMQRGDVSFTKGEFKEIDLKTDDIRKALFPMDFKEPSNVLFQMLSLLQDYANRVTTVSEALTGDMPRSGTGSMGVVNLIEQGLKVFASIFKRVHRSFGKELRKVYDLNGIYLDETEYFNIIINQDEVDLKQARPLLKQLGVGRADFQAPLDVMPVSDPNIISKTEKNAKAQSVYQTIISNPLFGNNPISNYYATEEFLRTFETNEARLDQILKPVLTQIQLQEQEQQLQIAELQQRQQALAITQAQLTQGIVPPEVLRAAVADQVAQEQIGLGNPQAGV